MHPQYDDGVILCPHRGCGCYARGKAGIHWLGVCCHSPTAPAFKPARKVIATLSGFAAVDDSTGLTSGETVLTGADSVILRWNHTPLLNAKAELCASNKCGPPPRLRLLRAPLRRP
jgi:hypothetical protein